MQPGEEGVAAPRVERSNWWSYLMIDDRNGRKKPGEERYRIVLVQNGTQEIVEERLVIICTRIGLELLYCIATNWQMGVEGNV